MSIKGKTITRVQLPTPKIQKNLFHVPFTSRGYKKDIARENPDFIGVFTVLYGKISATVFVDINRSFSLYIRFLNSHTTEHPIRRQIEIKNL